MNVSTLNVSAPLALPGQGGNNMNIPTSYRSSAVPQYNPKTDRFEFVINGMLVAVNNLSDAYVRVHREVK